MYKQMVFCKPPTLDKATIKKLFNLKEVFENERTCILENNEVSISIDKKVIRAFVYDDKNTEIVDNIEEYFYGKKRIRKNYTRSI